MKRIYLLLCTLLLSLSALAQTTPWATTTVTSQTRKLSGFNQLRWLWGGTILFSFPDTLATYIQKKDSTLYLTPYSLFHGRNTWYKKNVFEDSILSNTVLISNGPIKVTGTNGVSAWSALFNSAEISGNLQVDNIIYANNAVNSPMFHTPKTPGNGFDGPEYDITNNNNSNFLILTAPTISGSNKSQTFQNKGGVIALTSDTAGIQNQISGKRDTIGGTLGAKLNFKAKGDAIILTDAATTASSTTVTSALAHFTSGDVGKTVGIPYAGTDTLSHGVGKTLMAKIVSVTDAHTIVLNNAAVKTVVTTRRFYTGAMAIKDSVLVITGGDLTKADIGKKVTVYGAGPKVLSVSSVPDTTVNRPLDCYILNVTDATHALLSKWALTTSSSDSVKIAGASLVYGTDDSAPLQNALDTASLLKKPLILETGRYLTTVGLKLKSNINLSGYNRNSVLIAAGTALAAISTNNNSSADSIIQSPIIHDFEIDGSFVRNNVYSSMNNCILIRPTKDMKIYNMYMHNSAATCISFGYADNFIISHNTIAYCGLQVQEPVSTIIAGGNGIGDGTGRSEYERGVISENFVTNSGDANITVEGQNSILKSKGILITNNHTEWGVNSEFKDCGTDGTVYTNNESFYGKRGIIGMYTTFKPAPGWYPKNGTYTDNYFFNCLNGIQYISQNMGVIISRNRMETDSVYAPQNGILVQFIKGMSSDVKDIVIEANYIKYFQNKGISFETDATASPFTANLVIKNNNVINVGTSGSTKAAIRTFVDIANFDYENNFTVDNRPVGLRGMSYGFQITGKVVTNLFIGNNTALGFVTGTENLAGTVTTTTRRPDFALAGTWAAQQTFTLSPIVTAATVSSLAGFDASKKIVTITALPSGTTATTQAAGTNNTTVATSAALFAERTNTATLTNKTLTSPILNTTSVVGQVWAATNTAGAGNWATFIPDTTTAGTGLVSKNRLATNLTGYGKLGASQHWTSINLFDAGIAIGTTSFPGQVTFQGTSFTTALQIINPTKGIALFLPNGTASDTVLTKGTNIQITGTPTIVAGAGAGTSPTVSVTTNGRGLQVTVTVGTLPTASAVIATVTLPNAMPYTPYPVFSSPSGAGMLLTGTSMIGISSSGPSNVTLTAGTVALPTGTYIWNIKL